MNLTQIMIRCGKLLADWRIEHDGPAHLCLFEGVLGWREPGHTYERHPTFGKVNRRQIENGLTADQWVLLCAPVMELLRKDPKCLKLQKLLQPMSKTDCSIDSGPKSTEPTGTKSPAETTQ